MYYNYNFNPSHYFNINNEILYNNDNGYSPFVIYKNKHYSKTDKAVYSDRLLEWDYDKYNRCHRAIWKNESQIFDNCSPNSVERFLKLYFDKNILLTGIEKCYNVSTGYAYWIFYYKEK